MNRLMSLLALLLLTNISFAASPTSEFKLDNGLKIIVQEDHRAPVAVSMIWYKVGSAYEHGGITGISHALEHMMFKGTPKYPAGQFNQIIAANGGQQNAFTGRDFTAYFQTLAVDKLPIAFELEADRMRNLILDPNEFAKEIKVVIEERRMRTDDNPNALTYERFFAAAHLASPYHHPIVGWMNDLQHMTVNDLRQWYETWYAPNNATLVVVGDVDPKNILQLAKKYFANIKPSAIPASKPQLEPPALGTRQLQVNRPANLPMLLMGYNTPSIKPNQIEDWEPYALAVLDGILSGGESSRLSRELIRGQELAVSATSSYSPINKFGTLMTFTGIPAKQHTIEQLQQAFQQQINRLIKEKVHVQELERIKTQVIANKVYEQDSMHGQAMAIGILTTLDLPWQLKNTYPEKIKAITADQVQAVAQKYLRPENLTIAVLKPEKLS